MSEFAPKLANLSEGETPEKLAPDDLNAIRQLREGFAQIKQQLAGVIGGYNNTMTHVKEETSQRFVV